MAWLSGYLHRKPVPLTGGSDGAFVDFQLKLAIAFVTDHMQADFDDLRFTDTDGNLIDAWLEDKTDGTSADVWVEFPSTPANGVEQTYYMYYGKADAVDYWDGDATFALFDDFENDLSKWTLVGSPALSTTQKRDGAKSVNFLASANTQIQRTSEALSAMALEWYFFDNGDTSNLWLMGGLYDQAKYIGIYTGQSADYYSIYDGGYVTTTVSRSNGWHKASIKTADDIRLYIDDNLVRTITGTTATGIQIGDWASSSSAEKYVDDVFVRKYAANPPTYTFGSEENAPSGLTILDFERAGMRGVMRGIMRGVA